MCHGRIFGDVSGKREEWNILVQIRSFLWLWICFGFGAHVKYGALSHYFGKGLRVKAMEICLVK